MNLKKASVFIVALVALVLTGLHFYRTQTYTNYTIDNTGNSVIIELPNSKYLDINSHHDVVDNGLDFSQHPYGEKTKISKSSSGTNFAWFNKEYAEIATYSENRRTTIISPQDQTSLILSITSATNYPSSSNLKYYTQIDYSGKVTFIEDDSAIRLSDQGCTVTIDKNNLYEYVDYGNGKTIQILKDYTETAHFTINLHIDCVR